MNYLSKLMMALFFAVSLFFIPLGSQAQSVYFPPTLFDNDQIVLVYGHMGQGVYVDKIPSSSNTTIPRTISWQPIF